MILVRDLIGPAEVVASAGSAALLTIVHRCDSEADLARVRGRIQALEPSKGLEHVIVGPPDPGRSEAPGTPPHTRVVHAGPDVGLPALPYNLGIAAAGGEWVWLREPGTSFSPSDVRELLEDLSAAADGRQLVWLHPPGDPTRGEAPGIDALHNGLAPAVSSLIWRRSLFRQHGCLDPHVCVRETFAYEMLLRTVRHLRVHHRPTRDGDPPVHAPRRLVRTVAYSQSRRATPRFECLREQDVVDLADLRRVAGEEFAWRVYLEDVLPFLYRWRHRLPPSLPISPQSMPRRPVRVLFTKVQYETSNDLTFWHYARTFGDSRGFAFGYVQSEMLRSAHGSLLGLDDVGSVDVLVSTRTADAFNALLVAETAGKGTATAYMTDDDMLTFHEYGGTFAAFAPGTPHYDAMLQAIRSADVVIGFSDQIRHSATVHNPRYIGCEDSVPLEALPRTAVKPAGKGPFRFGYAGGGYRTAEFAMLKPAIERIVAEYGDAVTFAFWGVDPASFELKDRVEAIPFSPHYLEYLGRLAGAGFDAMLVPLMTEPAPKRAKNPNKFLETAVANAVGLFSDVPSYGVVEGGVTGIKVRETTEDWYRAMKAAIEMPEEKRLVVRSAALEYVRAFYTTPSLAWTTETGILAAQLHRSTAAKRGPDGRPVLAFFFPCVLGTGGGEIQLWRRFAVAFGLGFRLLVVIASDWKDMESTKPVLRRLEADGIEYDFVHYGAFYVTPETDVLPTQGELSSLRSFFARRASEISIVHSLALLPAVGQVCSEFGIPHLASMYGIEDDYEFPGGGLPFKYCDLVQSDSIRYASKWSSLVGRPWACARETVPPNLFSLGHARLWREEPRPPAFRLAMAGTFMERKSQLRVIEAMTLLEPEVRRRVQLDLYGGVDVYSDYGKACRRARLAAQRAGARVFFHGHVDDLEALYRRTDAVLSVSTFESFPSAIKEATATGCLVIASQAGGITEMMRDEVNCLLVEAPDSRRIAEAITRAATLPTARSLEIRRNAFRLACEEFHPRRTLHDLALCYHLAIQSHEQYGNEEKADSSGAQWSSRRDSAGLRRIASRS
jgi:glycosyltransferase involved in cell wall biosynthesis